MTKRSKRAQIFPVTSMVVIMIMGMQGCSTQQSTSSDTSTVTANNSTAPSGTSSATLPADFPVTLPPLPRDLTIQSQNGMDTVQCKVNDAVELVEKLYIYQLDQKGWSMEGSNVSSKDHVVMVASQGKQYVSITINKDGTGSSLQIVRGNKS